MTPEERKLVIELFDRLGTLEDAQRDPEAERLIRDGLEQAPNAPYVLVQTALVQDEALKRANARIRELEQGREAPPARDASFLGSMRDSLFGARESRGSVPSVRPDSVPPPSPGGMSPAWRTAAPPMTPAAGAAAAPMGMGGSFLGTAASTAAGVIGGALLLDGIRSMMGPHGAAHAAFDPGAHGAFDPAAGAAAPWSGAGGELSHAAGIDDIGRPTPATGSPDRTYGLSQPDAEDGEYEEPDDVEDDGGFDPDDGGDAQDV